MAVERSRVSTPAWPFPFSGVRDTAAAARADEAASCRAAFLGHG